MSKIHLKGIIALLFSISNTYAGRTSDQSTTGENTCASSSQDDKSKKPPRKNNTLIAGAAKQLLEQFKYLEKAKEIEEIIRIKIEKNIFEYVLMDYNINKIKNSSPNNLPSRFLNIKLNNLSNRRLSFEDNFLSFLIDIVDAEHHTYEEGKKQEKNIEFLLEGVKWHDIIPLLRSLLTQQGMEKLGEHVRYVDYVLHKENNESLFDFILRKEEGNITPSFRSLSTQRAINRFARHMSCMDSQRYYLEINASERAIRDSLEKKQREAGYFREDILKIEFFESIIGRNLLFFNDKARNDSQEEGEKAAILNSLASDPENFQSGYIPYNLPKQLDQLISKGRHCLSKKHNGIEFLLQSVIEHDLARLLQSLLTEKGMKELAKHLRYVDYILHRENDESLFDFLARKQKEEGELHTDSLGFDRIESLFEKNLLAFNVEKKELVREEGSLSPATEYSFAYDKVGHAHSQAFILEALASDPENFQNGYIPYNLPKLLDNLINKGKHYFLFFHKNFLEFRSDDSKNVLDISHFFFIMSHFLLNDEDPGWKEGFKTREERMRIACDFLKNCVNNSKRMTLGNQGKQNLEGSQIISKNSSLRDFVASSSAKRCIIRHTDFSEDDDLIDQFKLSLIPAHKQAEKFFSWMDFQEDFFIKALMHKEALIRFFWESRGDCYLYEHFQDRFPKFIQEHPEYAMEDFIEKKKACMEIMGIKNESDFLKKVIPIDSIKAVIAHIDQNAFVQLINDYRVVIERKIDEMFDQENKSQDPEEEGTHNLKRPTDQEIQ